MLRQVKERVADWLVLLGPENWVFQTIFRTFGVLRGFKIRKSDNNICIRKRDKAVLLRSDQFLFVPFMLNCFDLYFETIGDNDGGVCTILDFSKPGLHQYRHKGVAFYFPSIPEDDVMEAYTASYTPRPGDIVWDAGAHAGASSFFLAQMTGPAGKVYAFEPDERNYEFLLKNIELHNLSNVVPIRKALAAKNGTAAFCMEGNQASAISDYLPHSETMLLRTVQTISIRQACEELGEVPVFVKMDIEGAEVETVEGSLDFIRDHRIHFVFESNHRANGELTYKALERLFLKIGYDVWSSDEFGQIFTWARPR